MQFKKALKRLMLALTVLSIAACSSSYQDRNEQPAISTAGNNNYENGNISSSEKIFLKIEELKYNNIVYFDLNKYNIHSEYAKMLDSHAFFLRKNPSYKVIIEGHADERGTPEYNIALGERRANAVQMYLQSHGVSSDQLSLVSYGKEKPIFFEHDEMAWSKNRRATIVY